MKLFVAALMCLSFSSTYAKKAQRAPANTGYGLGGPQAIVEGFGLWSGEGVVRYVPLNPMEYRSSLLRRGEMNYLEPQMKMDGSTNGNRQYNIKPNFVREGQRYSVLTVKETDDKKVRYAFEISMNGMGSVAIADEKSGEKFFIDHKFCTEEIVELKTKINALNEQCGELFGEVQKKFSSLEERGAKSLSIASDDLKMNKSESGPNFQAIKKLADYDKYCEQFKQPLTPPAPQMIVPVNFGSFGI